MIAQINESGHDPGIDEGTRMEVERALTRYMVAGMKAFHKPPMLSISLDASRIGQKQIYAGLLATPDNKCMSFPPQADTTNLPQTNTHQLLMSSHSFLNEPFNKSFLVFTVVLNKSILGFNKLVNVCFCKVCWFWPDLLNKKTVSINLWIRNSL